MSFGQIATQNLPRFLNYADALKRFNETVPIRGRANRIRPLGARQYADTFSIRQNQTNQNIELVLWETPVITVRPDDTFVVTVGKWSSSSTHQFISHCLQIGCWSESKQTVLRITGKSIVLPKEKHVTLKRAAVGNKFYWEVVDAPDIFTDVLNMKKANALIKRHKDFMDYCKNMVKLRKDSVGNIAVNDTELREISAATPRGWEPDWIELSNGKGGVEQHKLFYQAFMNLGIGVARLSYMAGRLVQGFSSSPFSSFPSSPSSPSSHWPRWCSPPSSPPSPSFTFIAHGAEMLRNIRQKMLKDHAEEVLDHVEMPMGKVPTNRYEGWRKA
jgi:hypothetical protein